MLSNADRHHDCSTVPNIPLTSGVVEKGRDRTLENTGFLPADYLSAQRYLDKEEAIYFSETSLSDANSHSTFQDACLQRINWTYRTPRKTDQKTRK
jgi:hypothetical protein